MAIHHSTKTKAEKLGIILTELGDGKSPSFNDTAEFPVGTVQAFWGKHNVYAFGVGAKPAVEQAEALIALKDKHPTCHIHNEPSDPFLIRVWNDDRTLVLDREAMIPTDALMVAEQGKPWMPTEVPLDGGEAHKAGFPITDNPYEFDAWRTDGSMDGSDDPEPVPSEEDDAARLWDEQWEASADEADAAEDEPDIGGSVVKPEYRIRYAEAGHPNHCGDWLANTLNNLVLGKTVTDLERLETIFAENGVDTSKYDRTNNGWQGRIRMTGRNMLARRVFINNGKLALPPGIHPEGLLELIAPGEWMSAQRFKAPKAKAAEVEQPDGTVHEPKTDAEKTA